MYAEKFVIDAKNSELYYKIIDEQDKLIEFSIDNKDYIEAFRISDKCNPNIVLINIVNNKNSEDSKFLFKLNNAYYIQTKYLGFGAQGSSYLLLNCDNPADKLKLKVAKLSRLYKNEIKIQKKLNILKWHTICYNGNLKFYNISALEYYPGLDLVDTINLLSQRKKTIKLNYLSCLIIALNITLKLYTLHKKNIIHGDIKPENIIIEPWGFAATDKKTNIIDFDLSYILDQNQKYINTKYATGTVAYAPPELLIENSQYEYSKRTDIYSLGVIFKEVLELNNLSILKNMLSKRIRQRPKTKPIIKYLYKKIIITSSKNLKQLVTNYLAHYNYKYYIAEPNILLNQLSFETYLDKKLYNPKLINYQFNYNNLLTEISRELTKYGNNLVKIQNSHCLFILDTIYSMFGYGVSKNFDHSIKQIARQYSSNLSTAKPR